MYNIGLTGGIGSGKSTIAQMFADLGITVISADKIARDLVQPGTPCLQEIVQHFGTKVLTAQQQLDRPYLRDIIFADPIEKAWLENLLHPLIRKRMLQAAQQAQSTYTVLEIPLLLETNSDLCIQRILVVDAPEKLRIQRLQQKFSMTQIKQTMKSQSQRQQRLAAADDVIQNDTTMAALRQKADDLHVKYLKLASNQNKS